MLHKDLHLNPDCGKSCMKIHSMDRIVVHPLRIAAIYLFISFRRHYARREKRERERESKPSEYWNRRHGATMLPGISIPGWIAKLLAGQISFSTSKLLIRITYELTFSLDLRLKIAARARATERNHSLVLFDCAHRTEYLQPRLVNIFAARSFIYLSFHRDFAKRNFVPDRYRAHRSALERGVSIKHRRMILKMFTAKINCAKILRKKKIHERSQRASVVLH